MRKIILITIMLFSATVFAETKLCYVKVSQEFKEQYDGYRNGVNVLKTATDTAGNIVVSCNAMNEFPELFNGMNLEILWLSVYQFPRDTTNLE